MDGRPTVAPFRRVSAANSGWLDSSQPSHLLRNPAANMNRTKKKTRLLPTDQTHLLASAPNSTLEMDGRPTSGISQGKIPTPGSIKLPPTKKLQGVGIVRLGDVSSLAAWTSTDGKIEITFDTAKLSANGLRDLERYRLSSLPIEVSLTEGGQAVRCVMIAFECKATRATFYLTKAAQR
jgi:hypothetical protein